MSEHDEQKALIRWCDLHPEAKKIFAIPNGTYIKTHASRNRAKAEGLRKGVPDLMLPVARHGFNGLFIEMKKPKDKTPAGKPTKEQITRLSQLSDDGYMAVLCVGWDAARKTIEEYLC